MRTLGGRTPVLPSPVLTGSTSVAAGGGDTAQNRSTTMSKYTLTTDRPDRTFPITKVDGRWYVEYRYGIDAKGHGAICNDSIVVLRRWAKALGWTVNSTAAKAAAPKAAKTKAAAPVARGGGYPHGLATLLRGR